MKFGFMLLECVVLFVYSKMWFYDVLFEFDVFEDLLVVVMFVDYFLKLL